MGNKTTETKESKTIVDKTWKIAIQHYNVITLIINHNCTEGMNST